MEKDKNGRKKYDEKKTNNKLTIVLIVIIIALVFTLGYLIGTKKEVIKENNEKIEEKAIDKETKEESKRKDEEAEEKDKEQEKESKEEKIPEFEDGIPYYPCSGSYFPFEEKNITINDLDNSMKIGMLITFLSSKKYNAIDADFNTEGYKRIAEVTEDDAKKYFADTSFFNKISSIKAVESGFYSIKKVNGKYYLILTIGGCEGPTSDRDGAYVNLVNTRREGKYVVKTYSYYTQIVNLDKDPIEENDNTYFYSDYYKDSKHKILLAKDIYKKEQFEQYKNKLNTYDLYYDISNNNIRFEKMVYHENKN